MDMEKRHEEILGVKGVKCVEVWKSYIWPPQYEKIMKSRMAKYTREDWHQMKIESAEVVWMFLEAFKKGLPYTSEEAMAAAEANKDLVAKWWAESSYDFEVWMARTIRLKTVAKLFSDDRGFYDKWAEGLGDYVYKSIVYNASQKTGLDYEIIKTKRY